MMERGAKTTDCNRIQLPARVDVSFVGDGTAAEVFGGYLRAWSFEDYDDPRQWYEGFRAQIVGAIGRRFVPIYRMADGEFRFLMGRKFNRRRKPLSRELVGYLASRCGLQRRWSTSWGESYAPDSVPLLRTRLLQAIRQISQQGYLAMFVYDNGIHAFEEYNAHVAPYLAKQGIELHAGNYVPFHFPVTMLVDDRSADFFDGRHVLLATSFSDEERRLASRTLSALGAKQVSYVSVSPRSSLLDVLNLSDYAGDVDLCLVSAGIGAANIVTQLAPLGAPTIDVGGFARCLIQPNYRSHCLFTLAQFMP